MFSPIALVPVYHINLRIKLIVCKKKRKNALFADGLLCIAKVFSPVFMVADQELLYALEKQQILIWTPARRVGGKRVVCYDDR